METKQQERSIKSHQPKKLVSAREAGDKAEFTSAKSEAERSFGVSQSDSPKGMGEAEFTSARRYN
ncbi:hypothetical protein CQA49_00050 [Helicobacter sp. MIT 00-7814]|uniref:hypothetical protein n=1 Tax=unclassified Helicobacter TaxID=2593540 RepID=UPI000E1FA648|nr:MULTISPECIES: hypothetical protein [unclassified Helicobacter]RDU57096.1 hypothetical protein CQA49_00050 [Helicobacter sp. MIT 00-7814]RDU57647.1 hypothetical protein CQA37_00050 [Helicobacter sp. MIT 99-10781]